MGKHLKIDSCQQQAAIQNLKFSTFIFALIFVLTSQVAVLFLEINSAVAKPATITQAGKKAKELEQLQGNIKKLRKSLKTTRGKKDKTQNELRKAEKHIASLSLKLRKIKKELRVQGKRLEQLESEQSNLQTELSRHRDILSGQIRASYIMGHQEQLKLLLNQSDPSRVQRTVAYYDYLNRSRTQQIKTVIEKLERLQQIETAIAQEREKQTQLYSQSQQERKQLKEKRRHRTALLDKLNKDIQTKDKSLHTMLENEKELKDLLQALEKVLSDIPPDSISQQPFSSLKGQLAWPSRGKITKRFGKRRNMGNLRWKGMVISAPMGSNVHAVSHGRVAFADWLRGYGLIIIIDHGNGYMSLYGQNQHLLKETGEWVEAGEIVASVGDSGGQANAGLYFELRYQGKPVNPMKWCKKTSKGLVGLNYQ